MAAPPMVHLNGNCLAAVYIETSGREIGIHDILEVCVLPLDNRYRPRKDIIPFSMLLKAWHPKMADPKLCDRTLLTNACLKGANPYHAADLLSEWFNKLNLAPDKRIMPISHNWMLVGAFLRNWLNNNGFDLIFHDWARDLIACSLYANDSADAHVEQIPYPKSKLGYLCSTLKVTNEKPGDALADCLAIAECYSLMLRKLF
jgi:hypothetical protein